MVSLENFVLYPIAVFCFIIMGLGLAERPDHLAERAKRPYHSTCDLTSLGLSAQPTTNADKEIWDFWFYGFGGILWNEDRHNALWESYFPDANGACYLYTKMHYPGEDPCPNPEDTTWTIKNAAGCKFFFVTLMTYYSDYPCRYESEADVTNVIDIREEQLLTEDEEGKITIKVSVGEEAVTCSNLGDGGKYNVRVSSEEKSFLYQPWNLTGCPALPQQDGLNSEYAIYPVEYREVTGFYMKITPDQNNRQWPENFQITLNGEDGAGGCASNVYDIFSKDKKY